jgi:hypothetical protein
VIFLIQVCLNNTKYTDINIFYLNIILITFYNINNTSVLKHASVVNIYTLYLLIGIILLVY